MTHTPPIIELVPMFRCPHCEGRPRLYVHKTTARAVRYFRCKRCTYRIKVGRHHLVCGSPDRFPSR